MAAEAEDESRAADSEERSSVGNPTEGPNQQHLKEVHKDYRVIEKSRQGYHNESENIMRKQEALLANLKTENRGLREKVETYMIPDVGKQASLLQAESDKFSAMVVSEAKRLEGLEALTEETYTGLLEAKHNMGGIFAARDKYKQAVIRVAICENRLHKAVVDLNVVKKQNKVLKKKMEELEEEKKFYDHVKMNMEREVAAMEDAIEQASKEGNVFYEDRNDYEERITDIHEIVSDMRAYSLWQETEGWAIMDPEPLAKVVNPADQFITGERGKPPRECTEEHRLWIEMKALAYIQDILGINDPSDVVNAVKKAQLQNGSMFDLVNKLFQIISEADGKLEQNQVKITVNQTSKTALINRKVDMESTLEGILDLLKDLNLSDDELLPIIREMRKQLGAVFKEAGCNVEDEEVDYNQDSVATVTYKTGKRQPLEVAIVEFFSTIEHFIDQLSVNQRKGKVKTVKLTILNLVMGWRVNNGP